MKTIAAYVGGSVVMLFGIIFLNLFVFCAGGALLGLGHYWDRKV